MTHPASTSRTTRGRTAPLLAATALIALAPTVAVAQSEAPDCIAIVQEMLSSSPSAGTIHASAGCPSTGPVSLAFRWTRRGTRSSAERAALVESSALMRDGRLYEAILAVVRDEASPAADRLAGIKVLTGYADAGNVMQQGNAYNAHAAELSGARAEEADTAADGSVPLSPTVRADTKRELLRVASVDRDGDVRFAAQKACEHLGYIAAQKSKVATFRAP